MSLTSWDEPIEYEDDELAGELPPYQPEPDPLTRGVGGQWYVTGYTVDECQRTYAGSAIKAPPERFDRFYLHSDVGALLIDVLVGDGESQRTQAARKHVAFKRAWCAKHDRRYLVLTEDDAENPDRVRALLQDEPAEPAPEPATEAGVSPRRSQRGKVQRPKATA